MTVYLVGAGPGDPGLLTRRGAEVLARADVVVHDRLADASLLGLAPAGAERVDVGKSPGGPVRQHEIDALLVERGRAGLRVVRLKGGDPFVFGRGGEEAAALLAAGVPFEVVPGVTSAVAVPAYAGIPVTHRGVATSFTVVTGHLGHDSEADTQLEALAAAGGTIVVLMGVASRKEIARRLLDGGLPPTTAVAAVRWGTRPEQSTVRTTLERLADAELEPPVTLVVGRVAELDLAWFERRPLFGRRVVVTRAREQASDLVERLREAGAETVELPAIAIADPADGGEALRAAAGEVAAYDWVVFTSARAVERFVPLLRDARAFGAASIAAIGPGTAGALASRHLVADLVPPRFVAESLLEAFPPPPRRSGTQPPRRSGTQPPRRSGTQPPRRSGTQPPRRSGTQPGGPSSGRVLLPRAAVARDVLPEGLRAAGWEVDVVEAYRTEAVRPDAATLAAAKAADAITFTASSTVANYLEVAGPDAVPPFVACIGPVTARTARAHGLRVDVVSEVHTVEGLVDALVGALGSR